MNRYDFANILFAGPCNLHCPFCIGRQIDPALSRNNLDEFPPRNLEVFVGLVMKYGITEIVFTGTTTDPQLYRHEARLLSWLRGRLPAQTRYSLHTNGLLALRKMEVFNCYDRVSISFPSFDPSTFRAMTGCGQMPDLAAILRQVRVPVKLSCVITEHNASQVDEFLRRCKSLGVKRVVFRKLYGETRQWLILGGLRPQSAYRGNPVYDYDGMQVTYWDFCQTTSASLNLFSNGVISSHYLLERAPPGSKECAII